MAHNYNVGCMWHPWIPSHIFVKLIYELVPKVFKVSFFIYWEMTKACGTRWRKRKEEEKAKDIRPCSELKQKTESHSAILEKHKWELQEVQSEEIERNTVSVREWKKKNETFFFTQVTYKEDKLVEFLWSFWTLQP